MDDTLSGMPSPMPTLLRHLVDDAAVFPPGNSSLPEAVRGHAVHRASTYADAVGPLLLPAGDARTVADLLDREGWPGTGALRVGLIARPGTDPALVTDAVVSLAGGDRVAVAGVEFGWYEGWRELGLGRIWRALEVGRTAGDLGPALADIRAARRQGHPVLAKFRTGPTPVWPWPDEHEVAGFLRATLEHEVPFKLTGGLHHAIRGSYRVDGLLEENHGLLNVLVAVAAALDDACAADIAGLLARTDAPALAAMVGAWTADTTTAVRAAFTSYGCCTVTDPLGELADLGLGLAPPKGAP
jgi:hypothetical protein